MSSMRNGLKNLTKAYQSCMSRKMLYKNIQLKKEDVEKQASIQTSTYRPKIGGALVVNTLARAPRLCLPLGKFVLHPP